MTEIVTLPGGKGWQVGGTEFVYGYRKESSADRLFIRKSPELVARYVELCKEFRRGAIVELGIAAGGSTALIGLLAQPQKLVACELDEEPVPGLAAFIDAHRASARIRPYYGVNQSDRSRLAKIVDFEFPGQRLDLVIDDASHIYDETRASFEELFPRLRLGGVFVIEDWWADRTRAKWVLARMKDTSAPDFAERERRLAEAIAKSADGRGPTPLHRLGIELLQVCVASSEVVKEVKINKHWIIVERGPAELDPAAFRLAAHYDDDWEWRSGRP